MGVSSTLAGRGAPQENKREHALAASNEVPTVGELKAAIPPHCFQRSAARSLFLVARDGVIISSLFWLAWQLPYENISFLGWCLWGVYAFLQGTAFTGWWVLAHECGHGGFSDYTALNDTVGFVLHSFCLVPYFSWQYSHAKHHSKTNHLLDGESHVPPGPGFRKKFGKLLDIIGEDGFAIFQLVTHLLLGWPLYLFFNSTGARRTLDGERITTTHDHFRPSSKLFPKNGRWNTRVFLSTAGCAGMIVGLLWLGSVIGYQRTALLYVPAYLWCNAWLVLYTWLQHTDPALPHYGDDSWTWMKGALSTIDRPYGVFDWMHHYIGSTHVAHHVFSSLPCYHAQEATRHIKAYLEPRGMYNYDDTNFVVAAWRIAKECHYVEDLKGAQYFKSLNKVKSG